MTPSALKLEAIAEDRPLPAAAVRRWLHGRWALLFSHADDFACYGFEADRWLVHVRDAFSGAGISLLALAVAGRVASWVIEVGGCATAVGSDETQHCPVLQDSCEETLRTAIRSTPSRFVMMLDDSLHLRRTFVYTVQDRLPSPIDLAAQAVALRRARAPRAAAAPGQRCELLRAHTRLIALKPASAAPSSVMIDACLPSTSSPS